MFNKSNCRAKNPAKCRHHGNCLVTIEDLSTQTNFKDYKKLRNLWNEQFNDRLPKKELVTTIEVDPKFYIESSKNDGTWEQGFIKDVEGNPIGFIKIHNEVVKTMDGTVLHEGPVLCDIQVNPDFKGKNAALAVFRVVKNHYKANHVWVGETFSETGYHMLLKLRGHSEVTGEQIIKVAPYHKENQIMPGETVEYNFVRNWETLTPQYRL